MVSPLSAAFGALRRISSLDPTSTSAPAPSAAPTPAPTPAAAPTPTGMMYTPSDEPPASAGRRPDVDYRNETVEGRIGGLLKTDQDGNYTHQVVRQAVDRQNQAFNTRGLLNTSMAAQAGQEAAISKAAEIAAVDAKAYMDNRTRLEEQDFELRGDYQKAAQDVNTNFQKMVDTINASQMSPMDKSTAIAQAQSVRDGELAYQNNLYSNMPRWKNEWLALAVPTNGLDVATVENADTLANIINDPAQPQAMRDAAQSRLAAVRAGGGGIYGAGGYGGGGVSPAAARAAAASAPNMVPLGPKGALNFDALKDSKTYRERYEEYLREGGTLSPSDWAKRVVPGGGGIDGGGYSDGFGANGVGEADAGDSGIGAGMSA